MHRLFAAAIILLVLACGAPETITAPTAAPKATRTAPTAMPEPTKASLRDVSHAALGDAWPLVVEDGTIICSGAAILLRTNRGLFAVNGTARGQRRWKDIKDITKPDPKTGLLMSVQPIIDTGLKVCQ